MHHAVEYEMNTAAAPETAMAVRRTWRFSAGKLRASEAAPQSSKRIEARRRIGIERRLLYIIESQSLKPVTLILLRIVRR